MEEIKDEQSYLVTTTKQWDWLYCFVLLVKCF